MIVTLASAPDGTSCYVRGEDIVTIEAPFAWSPSIHARVVRFRGGQQVIMLDTPANVQAVVAAIAGAGSTVQPAPIPLDPGATPHA